jgi:glycosyltransferase involved in cell wall biosynthesis
MNVLLINGSFPPDHSGGGLRLLRTYTYLAAKYNVGFFVICDPVRIKEPYQELPNVKRVSPTLPAFILIPRMMYEILMRYNKTDIVHILGPNRTAFIAALICRILKIPYISESSIDYTPSKKASGGFSKFFLHSFFKADGAIALTPRIAQTYKNFGMAPEKIFLRPNPVFLEDTHENNDADLLHVLEDNKDAKFHLIFGRIGDRKNQLEAVRVLAFLPADHKLIIAGPAMDSADEAYAQELKAETNSLGLQSRVTLYPRTVHNPFRLYRCITSLWCFSKLEGLPNVILEALWIGKPCFTTDNLGLGQWLIDDKNGAEIPFAASPQEKALLIARHLGNTYDEKAIQGRSRKEFSPDAINDKTYVFLKSILT